MKKDVFRPHLVQQVAVRDNTDYIRRANILKKNVSRFFTHLYAHLYGGKVLKDPWSEYLDPNHRHFKPDAMRTENGKIVYTEIKAASVKSSKLHSPFRQEENNWGQILSGMDKDPVSFPFLEYALFRYGTRETKKLHRLSNADFVQKMAEEQKRLVILPFNAFLYMAAFSRHETRNQETSLYRTNKQKYHVINGEGFNLLFENSKPVSSIARYPMPALEDLCVDDLEVEHTETQRIEGHYVKPFTIEPFPVTKYSVPKGGYSKLAEKLLANHKEIAASLGIRDTFQTYLDVKDKDIPF